MEIKSMAGAHRKIAGLAADVAQLTARVEMLEARVRVVAEETLRPHTSTGADERPHD